jgi:hypothetical protein
MDDKRSKMHGTPVSKEEVLADLGHPRGWLANSMKVEFRNRLCRGEADLDIAGIRGYGRMTGYLDHLRKEFEHPLGTGTGLIPPEDDARVLADAKTVLAAEIAKYEARLAELERSPADVARYVARMRHWLDLLEHNPLFAEQDPALEPIEELQELARDANRKRAEELVRLRDDIARYAALFPETA